MDISTLDQIDLRTAGMLRTDAVVGPDYNVFVVIDVLDPGLQRRILLSSEQLFDIVHRLRQRHRGFVTSGQKVNALPEVD